MNYRKKLYLEYISGHTASLYGKPSLERTKRQFPVWDKYFGRHIPDHKNLKILDIGCGYGGFVYYLKQKGYQNVLGVDKSKEQVEMAKKLGIENIKKADLREFLKNKEGFYDVIFARDVLEHFRKEEILEVLDLVLLALKPKGRFIIQVPNGRVPFGAGYRYADFTHEIAFTKSSLAQIFKAAGFKKINCFSSGPVPYGFKSGIRFLLWKIIELGLRIYLLIETGSGKGIFTHNIIGVAEK